MLIYYCLCAASAGWMLVFGVSSNRFMQTKCIMFLCVECVTFFAYMSIYYHVTIVETTCVILKLLKIYLNVVLKFMLNLCRGSYAAFLLKTACFQLDGMPAVGVLTNMGESVEKTSIKCIWECFSKGYGEKH